MKVSSQALSNLFDETMTNSFSCDKEMCLYPPLFSLLYVLFKHISIKNFEEIKNLKNSFENDSVPQFSYQLIREFHS